MDGTDNAATKGSLQSALSKPEEIIADIAAGRMVVLVDDEDRENEGDLVIAAEAADADAINFMATHGRGLVCLSMTADRVRELGLSMMVQDNKAPLGTAFTVSIEARENVTTGISAGDRAETIKVAIDPSKGAEALVTPGHVFLSSQRMAACWCGPVTRKRRSIWRALPGRTRLALSARS